MHHIFSLLMVLFAFLQAVTAQEIEVQNTFDLGEGKAVELLMTGSDELIMIFDEDDSGFSFFKCNSEGDSISQSLHDGNARAAAINIFNEVFVGVEAESELRILSFDDAGNMIANNGFLPESINVFLDDLVADLSGGTAIAWHSTDTASGIALSSISRFDTAFQHVFTYDFAEERILSQLLVDPNNWLLSTGSDNHPLDNYVFFDHFYLNNTPFWSRILYYPFEIWQPTACFVERSNTFLAAKNQNGIRVVKLNPAFGTNWEMDIPVSLESDELLKLCYKDQNYFVADAGHGLLELHVLNKDGDHLNTMLFDHLDFSSLAGIIPTNDGYLWLGGTINSESGSKIFLMKVAIEGLLTDVPDVNQTNTDINIYPNPATDKVNILCSSSKLIKIVRVQNIAGKNIDNTTFNAGDNLLYVGNLRPGIYLITVITTDDQSVHRKLIIQ